MTKRAGETREVAVQVGEHALTVSLREVGGDQLPLVLFHGTGTEFERWGAFREHLDRTTVAFNVHADHLGRRPSIRGYAAFVDGVLGELDMPRVDLLGLSWGGMLAQQLTYDHPSRVRRLVLASTSPGFLSVPARPRSFAALLSPKRDQAHMTKVVDRLYGGDFRTNPGLVDELGLVRSVDKEAYRRQLLAIIGWTSMPWLASLRKRTLILHANDDPLVPFINSKIMRRLLRDSRLRVAAGGGHLFLLTRPQEYAAIINDFLDQDDRSAPGRLDGAPDTDGLSKDTGRSR